MMRGRGINLQLGNRVVPFQVMLESGKYMLRGLVRRMLFQIEYR
jgi:hypothetical protein